MFKNKTPVISFHCLFILWCLSKWTNEKYVMKRDVKMTAETVVTQLNTQEAVVWEAHSALFIGLQVCVCVHVHECVPMCSLWVCDRYKVLASLCVCMSVHLYMYLWVKFIRVCMCVRVRVHKCVCVFVWCVCVCGAAALSGLPCVYLGLIPDLHHFSADSSIPPSLYPSGYLQVYRRLPFPSCQHPIRLVPSLLRWTLFAFILVSFASS